MTETQTIQLRETVCIYRVSAPLKRRDQTAWGLHAAVANNNIGEGLDGWSCVCPMPVLISNKKGVTCVHSQSFLLQQWGYYMPLEKEDRHRQPQTSSHLSYHSYSEWGCDVSTGELTWGLCVSQSMAWTAAVKCPPLCRCWCVGSDLALPLLLVPEDPPSAEDTKELWV